MNDLHEIKEELIQLTYSGRKEEAIQLLIRKYGVTTEEAEQLLSLALKESFTPLTFFKQAAKAGSTHLLGKGKGCKQTLFGMIAFGFGFFGIPTLLMALGIFVFQHYQISNSVKTVGFVSSIVTEETDAPSKQFLPIISHEVAGKQYSKKGSFSSNTLYYSVGDSVNIYVNQHDPNDIIIDNFSERWLIITIIGGMGLFFTIVMVVFIRMSRQNS